LMVVVLLWVFVPHVHPGGLSGLYLMAERERQRSARAAETEIYLEEKVAWFREGFTSNASKLKEGHRKAKRAKKEA